MKLYTPTSLKQQSQLVDDEWIAQYKGYFLRSAFQPIWTKSLSEVYGYEGLLRVTKNETSINPIAFYDQFTDDTELTNVGALCCSLHVRNFSLANLPGKIFLNAHPTMFARISNDDFSIGKVLDSFSREGVAPERVVCEITEFKESNTEQFVSGITMFRKAGTLVAIDDYGQQESNEHRVDLLNPDIVKIDRSIIREFCSGLNNYLPELIERLSSRGYITVLEGVETDEEHRALQAISHTLVQGYYYGLPLDMKTISMLYGNCVLNSE